jgi:hypothetical protein
VFVELERTKNAPEQIKDLLNGLSQLCDCTNWRFRWYKDSEGYDFSEEEIKKCVPLTPEEYEAKVHAEDTGEVADFFDQGSVDEIEMDESRNITFTKLYSESLTAKLLSIGSYESLKDQIPGAIQLDETSRTQTIFLEKYLGNYEIHKIDNKFLIRNGNRAVIIQKESW